jgi:hypothetical protein
MRRFIISGLALILTGAAGCASLVTPADPLEPLKMALTEPAPSLEARAARGENAAEYAVSFLARFGVRGVPHDEARADRLRAGAATPTTLMITQYIPAIGGGTGRTSIIPVTQPGLSRGQMDLMDLCGLAALAGVERMGREMCSPEGWDRIAPLARQVVADNAASTPLP